MSKHADKELARRALDAFAEDDKAINESQPDPFDPALKNVEILGRRYPILTPLEMHVLSRLGLEDFAPDDVGAGIRAGYLVWLAQRRYPGHIARLNRLISEPMPATATRWYLPGRVRWWHRLMGWITGRRPYDWTDLAYIPILLAKHQEHLAKKAEEARGKAVFVP